METAILLCVPEAEELVGPWREKADPSAARGVPAHVTLLTPFLPADRIDDGVIAELGWFFAGIDAFTVRFDRVGEFADPGVVFLDPVGHELDDLATALTRRWPEAPPYEGRVEEPHAHLTVVHTADAALREQAAEEAAAGLPLVATIAQAALWTCDEHGRWNETETFAFGVAEQPWI